MLSFKKMLSWKCSARIKFASIFAQIFTYGFFNRNTDLTSVFFFPRENQISIREKNQVYAREKSGQPVKKSWKVSVKS